MFSEIFFSFISLLNYVPISFSNYQSNAYMFQQKKCFEDFLLQVIN